MYVSNALAERVEATSKGNTMNGFRQSLSVRKIHDVRLKQKGLQEVVQKEGESGGRASGGGKGGGQGRNEPVTTSTNPSIPFPLPSTTAFLSRSNRSPERRAKERASS